MWTHCRAGGQRSPLSPVTAVFPGTARDQATSRGMSIHQPGPWGCLGAESATWGPPKSEGLHIFPHPLMAFHQRNKVFLLPYFCTNTDSQCESTFLQAPPRRPFSGERALEDRPEECAHGTAPPNAPAHTYQTRDHLGLPSRGLPTSLLGSLCPLHPQWIPCISPSTVSPS